MNWEIGKIIVFLLFSVHNNGKPNISTSDRQDSFLNIQIFSIRLIPILGTTRCFASIYLLFKFKQSLIVFTLFCNYSNEGMVFSCPQEEGLLPIIKCIFAPSLISLCRNQDFSHFLPLKKHDWT